MRSTCFAMSILDTQRRKPARNTVSRGRRMSRSDGAAVNDAGPSLIRRTVSLLRYVFYALLVCTFMALIAVGGIQGYAFVTDSPYFAIKDIRISGTHMLSQEAVLELTNIELGANCFSVDLNEVEERVAMSPWCASVSVKRLLPDSFDIVVQEYEPVFWMVHGGELYYADIQGNILAPVVFETFMALPQLTVGSGGEALLPRLAELFEAFKQAQVLVNKSLVSWVRLSAGKGIEWYIDEPAVHVSVDVEDLHINLERMRLVLKDLGRRGDFSRIKEIIVVDGSVWVIANDDVQKNAKTS